MSWIKREAKNRDTRRDEAIHAMEKSEKDYQDVQRMRPVVAAQVNTHLALQQNNHFSERLFGVPR